MTMEDYKYLEPEQLPCLVLAIVQTPQYPKSYNFKPTHNWVKIAHQTAGNGCHQVYMNAIVLKCRDFDKINTLAKHYDNTCMNMLGLSLNEIVAYRKYINDTLNVDCNESYHYLEEGIYPIDATTENIKKLCKDNLPKDLDNLIDWRDDKVGKYAGCINRWYLFILGENCD